MATVYDVMGALETLYPLRYAEDWDHPGLIVGDLRNTVNNIVFAADPTMEVVEDAIASGADMLVTHHPLFFRAVHEVSGRTFRGRIVNLLAKHDCALWVGHTNADAAYRGVAQAAADAFGLENQAPIVRLTIRLPPIRWALAVSAGSVRRRHWSVSPPLWLRCCHSRNTAYRWLVRSTCRFARWRCFLVPAIPCSRMCMHCTPMCM